MIAPHTDPPGAQVLAERVRRGVESHAFNLSNEAGVVQVIPVTISVGIASLGAGIESQEALVEVADQNIYRAKQAGRNRVVVDAPSAAPL